MIEILVSLGIILVGLLGVAALLPIGRYDIMVAAKADRGAACARAVMRDLLVRGMVDPTQWVNDSNGNPYLQMEAVIDPMGFVVGNTGNNSRFPSYSIFDFHSQQPIDMPRVTIDTRLYGGNPKNAPSASLAQRLARWRDDLQFDLPGVDTPGERTDRPRGAFRDNLGNQVYLPDSSVTSTAQTAESAQDYSWIATVSPTPETWKRSVSVAVFYSRSLVTADPSASPNPRDTRSLPTPAGDPRFQTAGPMYPFTKELACAISFLGGGDFWLYVPTGGPFGPPPANYDAAAVREKLGGLKAGDWVLLRGMKIVGTPPNTTTLYAFKWYRVAALGDFDPDKDPGVGYNGRRLVTLAGPDWDSGMTTEVGLFDNIVGVYTETVDVGR